MSQPFDYALYSASLGSCAIDWVSAWMNVEVNAQSINLGIVHRARLDWLNQNGDIHEPQTLARYLAGQQHPC